MRFRALTNLFTHVTQIEKVYDKNPIAKSRGAGWRPRRSHQFTNSAFWNPARKRNPEKREIPLGSGIQKRDKLHPAVGGTNPCIPLEFHYWNLEVIWNLDIVAWDFVRDAHLA